MAGIGAVQSFFTQDSSDVDERKIPVFHYFQLQSYLNLISTWLVDGFTKATL